MKLARRILTVIDDGGPREQGLLQRILRAKLPEFERAIGHLVLKGMIVFRGKTSGRKVARNGRRMKGFSQIQLIGTIVVLLILSAGAYTLHSWWQAHNADQRDQGAKAERLVWEKREREQQQSYAAELERQRKAADARLAVLQAELNDSERDYLGRIANDRMETDRLRAELRAGRLVLVDPGGRAASGQACSGQGAAAAAAVAGGNAAPRAELSGEAAGFLLGLAEEADEVVEQLALAQDTVEAYYRLARDCHAAR